MTEISIFSKNRLRHVIDLILLGRAFEIKLVLCNARYELNHGVITDKYDSIWKLQ